MDDLQALRLQDDLDGLRLQLDWGIDEALLDQPVDRFIAPAPATVPAPARPIPARTLITPGASPSAAVDAALAAAAAPDLGALLAAMDSFDACPLRATASTTVGPRGNPAAGLLLVGEAPGPDDDRAGRALTGPTGERLDRALASVGLTADDVLLTLLIPWRPPGGRPVSEAERAICLPFFHRLIALAGPRHLVLMGVGPHRALGGDDAGFRKARGKWRDVAIPGLDRPVPALTMLAPDMWLSSPANRETTWTDLLVLRTRLDGA